MIKIKYVITAVALALSFGASARTLTPEEALDRIDSEFPGNGGLPMRAPKQLSGLRLSMTQLTPAGQPALYVFRHNDNRGYLVVSADDAVSPLLGYSDNGEIPERIPPAMQWWLEEYAAQIEYASNHKAISLPRNAQESSGRKAIEPMILTRWNQDKPFNSQCPRYGASETYTGCVATAMAQVMKYWEYPERGQNSVSYNASTIGRRLTLDFSEQPFDWDNMLPAYTGSYTQQQTDAVSYLMKACGYSVKMNYGTDSSGALSMNIPAALTRFFNYDPNINYQLRAYYGAYEWEEMMYDNLLNVGPVICGGTSAIGGGHSFVCDGYDGEGYFHFNWGWSGMSDGYFLLDALNPESIGIGGGSGGGYNFTQDAVFGIQPPTGMPAVENNPVITQHGSLAGYISDGILKIDLFAENQAMWVNYNPTAMKVRFGGIIEPVDGGEKTTAYFGKVNFTLQPGYGTEPKSWYAGIPLSELNLPDGTYKLTAATQPWDSDNEEWTPVRPVYGCYNHFSFTKSGDTFTIDVNDVDRLLITDGKVVGDLYYGMLTTVEVTVINDSDHEMTRGYAPLIMVDDTPMMMGESICLTVGPNSKETRRWTTPLYTLQQYFTVYEETEAKLTFYDEGTAEIFSDDFLLPVTLKPNPGEPGLSLSGAPEVANAVASTSVVGSRTNYIVTDKSSVEVVAKVNLVSGLFNYPMFACLVADDYEIISYNGYNVSMSEQGEVHDFRTTLNCITAETGKSYSLMMGYDYGSSMMQIGSQSALVTFMESWSGIDNVSAECSSLRFTGSEVICPDNYVAIFNMHGVKVAEDYGKISTGTLQKGVYVAQADGRTLKFIVP